MGMFQNFKTEDDGVKSGGDVVGGFTLFDSDVYAGKVKLVYFGKAQSSNAQFAEITIDIDGKELRERIFFTNRDGVNTYTDKKTGETKFLPGFETVNDLALVTTGFGLIDLEDQIDQKTVKIYDYEAKKELPQNVPCLLPVMGQEVRVAVQKQTVDKTKKNDSTGVYEATGETRDENIISKFFHAETGRTVTEIKTGIETPVFLDKWLEKNKGQVINRAKGAANNGSAPGRPAPGKSAPKNTSGLFGN